MKTTISDNIRLIRESKGYSQEYVSKKMKVTQQAYSAMEKKPENMTLARLKSLAAILDCTLISLIGEDSAYFQHNFNQQGGQAATQMVFNHDTDDTKSLYERYIHQLKEDVDFLRSQLKK
jgi:transcriptional regulator with XRE-family HTH domain